MVVSWPCMARRRRVNAILMNEIKNSLKTNTHFQGIDAGKFCHDGSSARDTVDSYPASHLDCWNGQHVEAVRRQVGSLVVRALMPRQLGTERRGNAVAAGPGLLGSCTVVIAWCPSHLAVVDQAPLDMAELAQLVVPAPWLEPWGAVASWAVADDAAVAVGLDATDDDDGAQGREFERICEYGAHQGRDVSEVVVIVIYNR